MSPLLTILTGSEFDFLVHLHVPTVGFFVANPGDFFFDFGQGFVAGGGVATLKRSTSLLSGRVLLISFGQQTLHTFNCASHIVN